MKTQEFISWLITQGRKKESAKARANNCETVCRYEGDLDELYAKDQCRDLLARLSYSVQDEKANVPPRHRIPIDGNLYNGTSTYRTAVNSYIKFLEGKQLDPVQHHDRPEGGTGDWPRWETPNEDDQYKTAQIIAPYVKFLSPDVIAGIVEDNTKILGTIREIFRKRHIEQSEPLYIWDRTSCCFPGVRRHSGNREIAAFKNRNQSVQSGPDDALELDDNSFPKQIWSFVFRGRPYNKTNPDAYQLAHLVDHKESDRITDEFSFDSGVSPVPLQGLFTCASNVVYVPDCLLRPTDFNGPLRLLLLHKAFRLYGNVCNLVPDYMHLNPLPGDRWQVENFHWGSPVGTLGNVKRFIDFRNEWIERLMHY